MSDDDWNDGNGKAVSVFLSGDHLEIDKGGNEVNDESFLVLINAADNGVEFLIPEELPFRSWAVAIATATGTIDPLDPDQHKAGDLLTLMERALVVLRGVPEE